MKRTLSIKNLYSKVYEEYPFTGMWQEAFGIPERGGIWLIYGSEKNGKTTFALMLANYFSSMEKVLYVSAEEGDSKSFGSACRRAGIVDNNRMIHVIDFIPVDDLKLRLKKRNSPKIVFIDNITIYGKGLTGKQIVSLSKQFKDVLFIYVAHEDNGEPKGAVAQMCKIFCSIFMRVQGLAVQVAGRCPGGMIPIIEEKAALIHGDSIVKK